MTNIVPADQLLVNNLLRPNNIEVRERIGKGAYSNVWLAYSGPLGKQVAVKSIDTSISSEYVRRFLPRELQVVQSITHDNIIKVHQVITPSSSQVLLIQEYGENGDLLQKIKRDTRIPEVESRGIFGQLIAALEYLSSRRIVHRDVKCENIMLDACDNVKLGDFGFARFMRPNEVSKTFCGSRAYVAPEILTGTAYTGFTVDVWSAGVVLYVMVTGVMPYDDRKPRKMLERMTAHRVRFPTMLPLSVEVRTLIHDILHPVPASRLTYAQMASSRWLAGTPYAMRTERTELRGESTQQSED